VNYLHPDHRRRQCKHGVILSECRCNDPNKRVDVVECPAECETETISDTERLDWLLKNGCVVLGRDSVFAALVHSRYEIDSEIGNYPREMKRGHV
jgi:hypothetical protein